MASSTKSKLQLNPISRDKVNLNSQTITTARAVSLQPVLVHDIIPGDSFNFSMKQFNRVDALPVSSFVQFKNRCVSFYVKNCQIWKPFDAYKTGAPYAFGYQNIVPTKKPFLSSYDLFYFFKVNGSGVNLATSEYLDTQIQDINDCYRLLASHKYDFIYYNETSDDYLGYKFTNIGRVVYKIFFQLGYRFPKLINESQSVDQLIQTEQHLFSLMSYLSVLVNYYVPLKWRSYQFVNSMSYLIDPVPQHFQSFNDTPSSDYLVWRLGVVRLLSRIYYGDDYFTSALVEPMKVPTGQLQHTVDDPSSLGPQVDVESQHSTPRITTDPDQAFTQYLVYALSCVTGQAQLSAMTLNDVKAATLAKFGYKAETADMVPYILDKVDDFINVIPEMSTADTYNSETGDGVPVGYKAGTGQGLSSMNGHYKFDNYGTFFVLNSIMPNYFYYQGVRRSLLRVAQDDEYDRNNIKLGIQAVARAELGVEVYNPQNTFGFVRKYADLSKGNDILGGDFVINTANEGLDSFHFGRDVQIDVANDEAFSIAVTGENSPRSAADGGQYNRVFVNSDTDPIQQWYMFNINATRVIDSTMTIGDNDGEVVETKPVGATLNS